MKSTVQSVWLIGVLFVLSITAASAGGLRIQVRTNMIPVGEFTAIRVLVSSASGRDVKKVVYRVDRSTDTAGGFRVSDLDLPNGKYELKVAAFDRNKLLTERPVSVDISDGLRVVTVLLVPRVRQFKPVTSKDSCVSSFNRKLESCRAAQRRCLLSGRGACDDRRQACDARAIKERQQCDASVRKTRIQMKKQMDNPGARGKPLIQPVKRPVTKTLRIQPAKKKPMLDRYSRSPASGPLNIRVNYIARKSVRSNKTPRTGLRPSNQIIIANVNYIARKSVRSNKTPRAGLHPSSQIIISNIDYIARKSMRSNKTPRAGLRPSNQIIISNINYIARKH